VRAPETPATPVAPKMIAKPGLLLLVCALLGFAFWLTACGESATTPESSTTSQAGAALQASSTTTPTVAGAATAGRAPVVGTFYLAEEKYTPAPTTVGDIVQLRDEDWVFRYEMSDPRLNGDQESIINGDLRADGSADLWGTAVIRNDDGTWECSGWTGTIANDGVEHYIWAVYEGTGAYAGLTYYEQVHFVEIPGVSKPPEEGVAVTGWIQATE
jgi:hypothetical protein